MNKLILSAAAAAALFAGATAANASNYGHGHGHGYKSYHEPVGYYVTKCHFVPVKIVKWVYGEKVIVWKNKKVCRDVFVSY